MRGILVVTILALTGLAGCAEEGIEPTDETEQVFDELETQATDETGVIRGVVLDPTIVPVVEATVAIIGTEQSTLTNENGAFAFEGLEPGTYFLDVSKVGYNATQSSVTVEAGVDRPDILKVQLALNPAQQPFVSTHQFDGFIQCSTRLIVIGLATCSAVGVGDEDFAEEYTPDFTPQWIQSELLWESTQTFGEELSYSITCLSGPPCPDGQLTISRHEGASPLLLTVNQTMAEQFQLGLGGQPITLRVFAHGHSSTDIPEEDVYNTAGIDCLEWPVIFAECIRFGGLGIVADQQFTGYTHIFNLYQPPADWRFSQNGAPPAP